MKKIFMLTLMGLVALSIMVFPCSAADIFGCYQKNNGQLRIVQNANECRPSEKFIQWNVMGLQGPTGPQGPQGPIGQTGPSGTVSQEALDAICQLAISNGIVPCPSFCDCYKIIFVSSASYDGNLGGLVGADSKCQGLALAAGLPGIYRAWLSDATAGPVTRFTHKNYPYKRVDGVVIAISWSDLVDGSIMNPIAVTETGGAWSDDGGTDLVWTYTRTNGNPGGWYNDETWGWYGDPNLMCGGWWSNLADKFGISGTAQGVDSTWSVYYDRMITCNRVARLYCVQQ
jgi:hypothetical protein